MGFGVREIKKEVTKVVFLVKRWIKCQVYRVALTDLEKVTMFSYFTIVQFVCSGPF